jgi:hypothetical protein
MHGKTGWKGRRLQLGLAVVLVAATLVIVAAALGKSVAGGFGETYKANPATLRRPVQRSSAATGMA